MEVDPYGWIIEECQITSSQESYLRKCPFAGQPVIQCDDDDSDGNNETPARIIMVSPPASPGHGDATQDEDNFHKAPECSLPDNNSSALDILLGLKSSSDGENELIEDLTGDLRSSDKGKEPMVNPDEHAQIPNLKETLVFVELPQSGNRKRRLDLSKNPIDGVSIGDGQVKPPTTRNEIFNNILGALKMVAGHHDDGVGGSEEVNLLETVKKRGMVFPRPRWWKDNMPSDAGKLSDKVNYKRTG